MCDQNLVLFKTTQQSHYNIENANSWYAREQWYVLTDKNDQNGKYFDRDDLSLEQCRDYTFKHASHLNHTARIYKPGSGASSGTCRVYQERTIPTDTEYPQLAASACFK